MVKRTPRPPEIKLRLKCKVCGNVAPVFVTGVMAWHRGNSSDMCKGSHRQVCKPVETPRYQESVIYMYTDGISRTKAKSSLSQLDGEVE